MATAGSDKDVKDIIAKVRDLTLDSGASSEDNTEQQVLIHVINVGHGDSILVELGEY